MNIEHLQTQLNIIDAAIALHCDPQGELSIAGICSGAEIDEETFYRHFNSKMHVLHAFYPLLITRYRLMIGEIEGFGEFDLAEKLSNLLFTLFDMLQERREFVDETLGPMVGDTLRKSPLEKELGNLFAEWLEGDAHIPATQRTVLLNGITYEVMAQEVIFLLNFWREDRSEGFQESVALADKLINFFTAVLHSPVVDRGIDLAGYLWRQQALHLPIPFFRFWMRKP